MRAKELFDADLIEIKFNSNSDYPYHNIFLSTFLQINTLIKLKII